MHFIFKSELIDYTYINAHARDTILFLHGWGGNKNSFLSTINLVKTKLNVITLTMPTIDPMTEIWTMHDYTNLVEQLLILHNIHNPIIVCHSFGFRITTLLNGKIDIKKIIVTGGAGLKKSNFYLKIIKNNNFLLLKSKKFKFLYENIASKDYINLSAINKQTFKNIVNLNTKNFIKFSCPLLLFWGTKDRETPIWIARKIRQRNTVKLITLEDDHFAYIHENEYFNNQILEFVL